jgi:hypothetical protein
MRSQFFLIFKVFTMKKIIFAISFWVATLNTLTAQNNGNDWLKTNNIRVNLGIVTMTVGDGFGPVFEFQYLKRVHKRVGIGMKIAFANNEREFNDFKGTTTALLLKTKASWDNQIVQGSKGLVTLTENEFINTHVNGNFIVNYAPFQTSKRSLNLSAGLGLGWVSVQSVPQAYLVDVFIISTTTSPQRAVLFVPDYTKLLDITIPISINYSYYLKKNWYIGLDLGATIYSKYTGWYRHSAFTIGVRFD